MAASFQISIFFFFSTLIIHLISASISQNPTLPKAAIFPLQKDPSTLQYVSKLSMGQDLTPLELVLDLNGPFIWADCESNPSFLVSQQPIKSCSLKCSMSKPIKGCYTSKSCTVLVENSISQISNSGEMVEDNIAIELWDGKKTPNLFAPNEKFIFSCAPSSLLKGLANGAKGMFGLGNSRISLPSQISTNFGFFQWKFSLCLSPSSSKGAIFLGGGPHDIEISSPMMYTPLISQQGNYYMDLSSIKISGKKLSLQQKGFIGAKLSTIVPYTTLETKIYAIFVEGYVKAAKEMNLSLVSSVAPFEVCFSSKGVGNTKFGPNVPIIELVLQSEMVKWTVYGKNSMVFVSDEIMCLGFLNGGIDNPKDMIVIGGYQMEDYLLEFNLGNSMLGVSSLVMGDKKCSDFTDFGFYGGGREIF
ncbi:hypothetical protein CASFOL_029770 [Castilleja foliolosa]|uniref:Peptidase A1 domain-containing protein n=1 Tax=Castilleja foliolosa TaxID=1961234 RepID=A0ABD3CA70_9LAMI